MLQRQPVWQCYSLSVSLQGPEDRNYTYHGLNYEHYYVMISSLPRRSSAFKNSVSKIVKPRGNNFELKLLFMFVRKSLLQRINTCLQCTGTTFCEFCELVLGKRKCVADHVRVYIGRATSRYFCSFTLQKYSALE